MMRDIRPETDEPPVPLTRAESSTIPTPRRSARPPLDTAQATAPLSTATATLDRWRLLRLVFAVQGGYYTIAALWPLLARVLPLPHFFSATGLTPNFSGTMIQSLGLLIGVLLLATVTRRRPDGLLVALGIGAALAYFLVELRYRAILPGLVYADLVFEAIFGLAMLVIYLAALIHDRRTRV